MNHESSGAMNNEHHLSAIGQVLVPVADVDRALAFYRDRLGLAFLFQYPGMGFVECGGIRLLLGVPEAGQVTGPVTVYYRVSDLDAAVRSLEERGVVFDTPPHLVHRAEASELWMAAVHDPDGNPVVLMSERPTT